MVHARSTAVSDNFASAIMYAKHATQHVGVISQNRLKKSSEVNGNGQQCVCPYTMWTIPCVVE